jgi:uncharacterized membrane protein
MLRKVTKPVREERSIPEHVGNNIQTVGTLLAKSERSVGPHQLAIERLMAGFGRPATVYVLVLVILAWIITNVVARRFGFKAFDPPPFAWLQCVTCVAALLVTLIILTGQNRMAKLAERRAHLDLQVNIIAEEKIAKIVALVEELRRDLPSVRDRHDPLAQAMTEAVNVHAVAEELDSESAKRL